jgi:hypothetical protein
MTESQLPPDADGAPPGPVASQPVPVPSSGGLAPRGTSPVAIAAAACGTGAVVLSVAVVSLIGLEGPTGANPVFGLQLLGICACPAAVVLGVVALVQMRRTKRRGTGLAVAGMVLGCAIPLLWLVFAFHG